MWWRPEITKTVFGFKRGRKIFRVPGPSRAGPTWPRCLVAIPPGAREPGGCCVLQFDEEYFVHAADDAGSEAGDAHHVRIFREDADRQERAAGQW